MGFPPLLWRSVDVELVQDDDTVAVVTLLRPLWWLEATGARVGGSIRLEAAEAGLRGWARILDIRADVTVDSRRLGPGKAVVIGTIVHQGARVIELVLNGDRSEPLGVTPAHPLYSADRQAWVPAGEVQVGERLQTHQGSTATVTEVLDEGRRETVYNLEVHRAQSYFAGPQRLLAHNTGFDCSKALGKNLQDKGISGSGRLRGYNQAASDLPGGLDGAKKAFRDLTGRSPKIDDLKSRNPTDAYIEAGKIEVHFRPSSKTGTPALEVIDHVNKTFEKIHFNP